MPRKWNTPVVGAKIGWRLSLSAIQNLSKQEKFAISRVQDFLKDKIYKFKKLKLEILTMKLNRTIQDYILDNLYSK